MRFDVPPPPLPPPVQAAPPRRVLTPAQCRAAYAPYLVAPDYTWGGGPAAGGGAGGRGRGEGQGVAGDDRGEQDGG